jgi:hypothetical protein
MNRSPNFQLLDTVMTHIEEHPDEHVQENWRCETGMCFAGWAVALSGRYEWVSDDPRSVDYEVVREKATGYTTSAMHAAEDLLGLRPSQGYALFHAGNSRDRLRQLIDTWKRDAE